MLLDRAVTLTTGFNSRVDREVFLSVMSGGKCNSHWRNGSKLRSDSELFNSLFSALLFSPCQMNSSSRILHCFLGKWPKKMSFLVVLFLTKMYFLGDLQTIYFSPFSFNQNRGVLANSYSHLSPLAVRDPSDAICLSVCQQEAKAKTLSLIVCMCE